ncbi:MAG: hypothetical protein UX62_C0003G0011 [Microgenomates group bacterium GW2011_GWA2_46_7]|nr:MAG: hypothetical protein UX62_C0003G0011 [Microgenomates group bacterium GW2011_GWA2_46_7]
MPNIKSLPLHLRPREKMLERGPAALSDAELLAILLRTGRAGHSALQIAESITKQFPNLTKLTREDLSSIKGIDTAKIASILAAIEISRRIGNQSIHHIQSPTDALPYLDKMRHSSREQFIAIYLNARHELVHQETISIGTLTRSLTHPREVYHPAITHLAASILVAHNHPSGDLAPSEDDLAMTKRLAEVGELLGIPLLDHLILTTTGVYSFREHGHLT